MIEKCCVIRHVAGTGLFIGSRKCPSAGFFDAALKYSRKHKHAVLDCAFFFFLKFKLRHSLKASDVRNRVISTNQVLNIWIARHLNWKRVTPGTDSAQLCFKYVKSKIRLMSLTFDYYENLNEIFFKHFTVASSLVTTAIYKVNGPRRRVNGSTFSLNWKQHFAQKTNRTTRTLFEAVGVALYPACPTCTSFPAPCHLLAVMLMNRVSINYTTQ